MHRLFRTVALLLLGLTGSAVAQGQRSMTLVDLLEVPSLGDPALSPDGRQLVYTMSRPDWKANRRVGHIWRMNLDGSATVQLTNGPRSESSPRWSPDGKTIAFLASRGEGEQTQIWLIDNAGGEARQLTSHETGTSSITWSPDGSTIYFLASDPKDAEEKEREKLKDDVYAFDENYEQRHLWKVTVADAKEQQITQGDFSLGNYTLSQDGRKVVHNRSPNPLLGSGNQSELWVMDPTGSNAVQLTRNTVGEGGAEISPDNAQILFTSDANERFEGYYNSNLFVIPAAGGEARMLLRDLPHEIGDAQWSRDGRSIYFIANMGVHSQLFQLDLATNRVTQRTDGRHAIGDWRPDFANQRHLVTLSQATSPGEVWMWREGSATPEQITHVFDHLARDFRLPRQERVEWKGRDGVTVEGLLYYPLDYQQGRRYPLVVQTHGGPRSSDKYGFAGGTGNYAPVLAAKGYVILRPNYRGSTGYGDAFLRDMVGHYFQNAHLDVMTGVDHLIRMGIVDSARMVKMGWSGGGHMTNKIITFTNRFKAASSGAGAANWISMYAQSDTRTQRTPWFGGTPWQANAPIDLYWEQSPLKYIANATTPTLILVGENDPRVPMPQSVELYRALKSNGVTTKLYVAPREPHGWGELRHQLFKMNAELDWFERHAMNRAYVWEKAPGGEPGTPAVSSRP